MKKFQAQEVTYIGHKLTAAGVKPDEAKIEAIKMMPHPEDKKGAERLLCMLNYLAKFIPNMSTMSKPIRDILKEDVEFRWGNVQEEAFLKLKERITSSHVLAYYDVNKPVTMSCDASKSGLGAVLIQEGKPVAYASRSLTDAETRYAQIEKELLTVVFGFERFNQYTYARYVEVETDHKPLVSIVKKSLTDAPPRLQRMLMRLQRYDFTLKYNPGKEMVVADTLSRAHLSTDGDESEKELQDELTHYVHSVVDHLPVSDDKLEQIRKEVENDPTMKELIKIIKVGWPENRKEVPEVVQEYWNYRDELSEVNGIILKGSRIIIPSRLRSEMLAKLRDSHMGMEKSKQRTRDVMFWPRMNSQIEDVVSRCGLCQEHPMSNPN